MMERPVADVVPPERQRQPAPGFGDGFRESWFANEDFVKGLIGQAGPGAPGVWESWKNLGLGIGGTIADPIGAIQDEIERAKNAPSAAHYFGGWFADASQSAVAGPFLGPEALAGRVAVRGIDTADLDGVAGPRDDLLYEKLGASASADQGETRSAEPSNGVSAGAEPASPAAGRDYSFSPHEAFGRLANPADEITRLNDGGVPSHVTDGYDPLAGRTIEQYRQEFTVRGSDGTPRWDWSTQAPNNGYEGTPSVADRIPQGQLLDRLGSTQGGFMADDGAPLSTRSMPPGVASQYNQYMGTGKEIPAALNAEVLYGPAKAAFGQPGGAIQWAVIDRTTKEPIPIKILQQYGIVEKITPQ